MFLIRFFVSSLLLLQHAVHVACSPVPEDSTDVIPDEYQKEPIPLNQYRVSRRETFEEYLERRTEEKNNKHLDPRTYYQIDEDYTCINEWGTNFNSWYSICNLAGTVRQITCRVYNPSTAPNNAGNRRSSSIYCDSGYTCIALGERVTRFGDRQPTTTCTPTKQVTKFVIKILDTKEMCGYGYFGSAGKGVKTKVHIYAWNMYTGVFALLAHMYFKINGAYMEAAANINDWGFEYDGLKGTDKVEFCGVAYSTGENFPIEGIGQITFID